MSTWKWQRINVMGIHAEEMTLPDITCSCNSSVACKHTIWSSVVIQYQINNSISVYCHWQRLQQSVIITEMQVRTHSRSQNIKHRTLVQNLESTVSCGGLSTNPLRILWMNDFFFIFLPVPSGTNWKLIDWQPAGGRCHVLQSTLYCDFRTHLAYHVYIIDAAGQNRQLLGRRNHGIGHGTEG